jgi:hypothetical protein
MALLFVHGRCQHYYESGHPREAGKTQPGDLGSAPVLEADGLTVAGLEKAIKQEYREPPTTAPMMIRGVMLSHSLKLGEDRLPLRWIKPLIEMAVIVNIHGWCQRLDACRPGGKRPLGCD